jgi:aldehyde dehydrogenase (NAD+)
VAISRSDAAALVPSAGLFIDGAWLPEATLARVDHIDPTTGLPLGPFLPAGAAEIDLAVAAARRARPGWGALAPAQRRGALLRIAESIEADAERLAGIMALEMGQPIRAATAGALHAAEWFRYFAGWADKLEGTVVPVNPGAVLDYVTLEAYGVVGAIIPWNGPLIALALKVAPALAAGNSVVLKPSELAPFSSLRFAQLCAEAGLPGGVVNVVPGGAEAGAALSAHPDVDKLSFTGSAATARAVVVAAAEHHTPVVLELGGKSASIVFEDANAQVVGKLAAILGLQQNSGQGCFLPTRLLVHRSLYAEVLDRVLATVKGFALGDPFDPKTAMGPVNGTAARTRILETVARARDDGDGALLVGGGAPAGPLAAGSFVEPTVFGDVRPASRLAQEEIFGPVLAVIPFDDEHEAVAIANSTRYGLAGYVWTHDLRRAHRVAAALEAGYVSVNGMAGLAPGAPFGGWGASGHGVEGGRWGLQEFLRLKNVHVVLN